MSIKLKPVSAQVIVVTGASSGIGLATARAAAARGAKVVMAARTGDVLASAAAAIVAGGGNAIAVTADVTERDDLRRVAETAIDRYGRIDTWVNNAGVGMFGRLEECSEDDMRQLFEIDFWGAVHGSLVALPYLKQQGGALINVGSMVSDRAVPMQGIYSAAKHAVKGFTDALRVELAYEKAPVSVTLVKPASIGTPITGRMKNYTDREPKLPPPVYAPEDVAAAILHAAAHPKRDAFVGSLARITSVASQFAPGLVDLASALFIVDLQHGPKPATPGDNLRRGLATGEVRGDTQGSTIRPSLYTHAALHAGITTVSTIAIVAALAGLALFNGAGRRRPFG